MEGMKPWKMQLLLAAVLVVLSYFVSNTAGVAVMSVDLGSESMKIAIVRPGVPMEIAYNKESRRKTPVVVSMRNGERLFGDPALGIGVKFPKLAYWHLLDLLGKKIDNPQVKLFQERFPYYNLIADEEHGTVVFKHDDETTYTPEELLAMVLENSKEIASEFAEQPVTDAVLTVPPYLNQAERRALICTAEIAGVKVLQLMNDNAAVALNYGIFRSKSFNTTAQHYMFYDMGASSTTATVVGYQLVKTKNPITGLVDTAPQLRIKGVGFDRNLGGLALQLRLRDHLAKLFNDQKKTKNDVRENPRAMAKLLKEAGRVKHVLSANNEHFAQVEGLLDDQDFRAKVTREEFEEMCKDLLDRTEQPIKDALEHSHFTADEISEVILMGAGTRVPKVQEIIKKAMGREELGKSINTDEAAALGAVYQAAHLSKGFRVKKFEVRDANIFPVQVEFERTKTDEDGKESTKTVKRTLFGRLNAFPQKKVMTFNKHVKDFTFDVNYGDLSFLGENDMKIFGSTKLAKFSLSGVESAHSKHVAETDPKGVKAHFKMDDSGLLSLDMVESVFEKPPPPEEEKKEEESTLSKLGSTISNLFGGKSEEVKQEGEVKEEADKPKAQPTENGKKEETKSEKTEDKKEETKENEEKKTTDEKKDETDANKEEKVTKEEKKEKDTKEEKKEKDTKEEKKEKDTKEEKDKDTKKDETDGKDKKDEKAKEKTDDKNGKKNDKEKEKVEEKEKPKATIFKEPITVASEILDLPNPSSDKINASKKKVEEMRARDIEKNKREKLRNELETFVYDAKDKLYQEDYEKCSTEAEREALREKLTTVGDWMEMDADDSTKRQEFEAKLTVLKEATKDLYDRVYEREERPRAVEAINTMLNYSQTFLTNMKNFTGEDQPFTKIEFETLEKLINGTIKWNNTIMEEQAKTPDTEKPKLLIQDVATKIQALDREVKYLINKAKVYRPKPKKEETPTNTTNKDSNDTKTDDKSDKTENKTDDSKPDSKTKEEEKKFEAPPPPGEEPKKTEEPKPKDGPEILTLDGSMSPEEMADKIKNMLKEQGGSKTSEEASKQTQSEDKETKTKSESGENKHTPDEL